MTTSGEEQDRTVAPTATDDWPRGIGEVSWWPPITALGIVGLYVGAGLYVLGSGAGARPVSPTLGVGVSIVGLLVAAIGAAGWAYQAFVARYWEEREDSRDKYLWGMLLYVPIELALLGGGILYFAFVYHGSWPPGELPPIFTPRVWVMTAALLVSSFTIYFAGRALREENRRRFLALLAATPLLGVVFLALKAWNWYGLVFEQGYTLASGRFWTAFFTVSGLHAVLVAVGVVLLSVVLARSLAGQITPDRHVSLTTGAMYWWILEAVWLVLLVEIYATAHLCRVQGPC